METSLNFFRRTGGQDHAQENPPLDEQPPNGLPNGADLPEFILKLDAEMVFLTFLLLHSGQATLARAKSDVEVSSDSNDFLQSWQRNS